MATTQLRIRLHTQSEDLKLPSDHGPVVVSTSLARYQLSILVNKLLQTEKPIPFEFLIQSQFLRTSLGEFLAKNGIANESVLNVEYVRALAPPLYVASYEHEDWVSAVDAQDERVLSGSYDGLVRVWNEVNEIVAMGEGHLGPVKAARFAEGCVVSGGMDRTVRVWAKGLRPVMELYGHHGPVESVAVRGSKVLSASADGRVGVWSTSSTALPEASDELVPVANKRRRLSVAENQKGPLDMLEGHHAQVSDVCFDEGDPTVAYSTSWDHCVKTWDLTTGMCVDTRSTAQSLLSICHLQEQSLLAVGTVNRHITLVDPRTSATNVSVMTLRGHTNVVVSLDRAPDSATQLISASHDGTCRIWDLRSIHNDAAEKVSESVYVIHRKSAEGKKTTKVFDVCWDKQLGVLSAGEDKCIQVNRPG
ncbi:WD domain, G-beta repeat-containing protein [Piedraia hortae CBS 480.64]|uniref:Ribosome biogenesis protein YTM1 n=1 Tax=Piedraia hortae CBS 480.64 TaxID=1314780 RepID=A0A6A7CAA1_9PEZI|nr:WD domain, G-beta repeat-containing protein [Piedraia hortae CBS 480.64]